MADRNPEVGEEAKKAFESLPEDVQVAAKRAELDRNLPVLSAILQEVGGVGVIAWAAYLDVMESGNCDPFDMREIVEAVAPRLQREERERTMEIVVGFYADAVRSRIVAEEQGEDSSAASIRVSELCEVINALATLDPEERV